MADSTKKTTRMGSRIGKWALLAATLFAACYEIPDWFYEESPITLTQYTLTISAMNGGTVSPAAGTHTYASGTAVNISATADSGYTFNNWTVTSGSGTATIANANSASTTVTLSANATIQANFTQNSGGGGTGCAISGYKTKKIGTQTWMAENLNCDVTGSKCYKNSADSCGKYGRLYTWSDALTACPSGWHLPSDAEWGVLVDYVGGSSTAGTKLKSSLYWNSYSGVPVGSDAFGFSALPGGGGGSGGGFGTAGNRGFWWSATEDNASLAWNRYMYYNFESVGRYANDDKADLFSVRCVAD